MLTSMRRGLGAALLVGACLAVAGAGCGEDSAATRQCDALGEKLCDRYEACQAGLGSQCRTTLGATLGCDDATGVSASYDTCLTDLDTVDCAVLLAGTLPDSCNGVILR